jgi:signal transduction histidine kinase
MRRSVALGLPLLFLLALLLSAPEGACAQPLPLSDAMEGISCVPYIQLLLDTTGALSIDDVNGPAHAGRFVPADQEVRFGYQPKAALWLRLPVGNRSSETQEWLLEIAYPHLDHVTLFSPAPSGGYVRRELGEVFPFSEREVSHHDFMFRMETPAGGVPTYFLRVETEGLLTVPVQAWSERSYTERGPVRWSLLFAFYGAALVIAAYNVCLFLFTRIAAYAYFALLALSMGLVEACLFGHVFQYLLPDQPAIVRSLTLGAINNAILCNALFARHHVQEESHIPHWLKRVTDGLILYAFVVTVLSMVLPFPIAAALTAFTVPTLATLGLLVTLRLRLLFIDYRHTPASGWVDALLGGWVAVELGTFINALMFLNYLPRNLVTEWAVLFGAAVQFVLVGASMQSRLNWLRQEDAKLNLQLADKIQGVASAIGLAESETARKEAATRAKTAVIATMTHELRTPLNAIINVPQGILATLKEVDGARCADCGAKFELDADDNLDRASPCPACGACGTLSAERITLFDVPAKRTLRHLALIEKSGMHLLRIVDGILEAGIANPQGVLDAQRFELGPVLRDVIDQTGVLAASVGVTLSLEAPQGPTFVEADELRLRQVLINLIGNAIKFSHRGGSVRVNVRLDDHQLLFEVSDDGLGIPKDRQAEIFQAYEQLPTEVTHGFGGTGLGLSIARSLVRLHGGDIWVESELGRGSTFSFVIPQHHAA